MRTYTAYRSREIGGWAVWIVAPTAEHAQALADRYGYLLTHETYDEADTMVLMLQDMRLVDHLIDKDGNELPLPHNRRRRPSADGAYPKS